MIQRLKNKIIHWLGGTSLQNPVGVITRTPAPLQRLSTTITHCGEFFPTELNELAAKQLAQKILELQLFQHKTFTEPGSPVVYEQYDIWVTLPKT